MFFFLSFAAKQEIEISDDSEPKFIISNEKYSWHSDFAVFLSPLALQLCHWCWPRSVGQDWFHPRCAAPWPLDVASAGDLLIFLGHCEATESGWDVMDLSYDVRKLWIPWYMATWCYLEKRVQESNLPDGQEHSSFVDSAFCHRYLIG